jgi:hypothetical protein
MKTNKHFIVFLLAISISCGTSSQILNLSTISKYGIIKYGEHDVNVIKDLISTCDSYLDKIAADLNLDINEKTVIEIYPDQDSYDKEIMNSAFRGTPAISGNGRIQMVSPLSRIKIDTICYRNRLLFLIHEYVHIMLDKPDPAPPLFIDEGLACYYSSYSFYKAIADKYIGRIGTIPTTDQLINQYSILVAPDLFSFVFIDFLFQTGRSKLLPAIVRNQYNLGSLNSEWNKYFIAHYRQKF